MSQVVQKLHHTQHNGLSYSTNEVFVLFVCYTLVDSLMKWDGTDYFLLHKKEKKKRKNYEVHKTWFQIIASLKCTLLASRLPQTGT